MGRGAWGAGHGAWRVTWGELPATDGEIQFAKGTRLGLRVVHAMHKGRSLPSGQ